MRKISNILKKVMSNAEWACWSIMRDKRYMNEETVAALGISWITFSAHLSPWLSQVVPWSLGNTQISALMGVQNKGNPIANTEIIFYIGWIWDKNGDLQGPLQHLLFGLVFLETLLRYWSEAFIQIITLGRVRGRERPGRAVQCPLQPYKEKRGHSHIVLHVKK